MIKRDLLGHEMWECDREDLRRIWREQPVERWRLCSHEEIDAHYLDGPEQIAAWIAKKQAKAGEYLDSPMYCNTYRILCSERDGCTDDCCYQRRI